MSKQLLGYNHETLFSFELLVKYIRVNKIRSWKSSEELALGVRLLDFPTLLIYQPGSAVLQDSDQGSCEHKQSVRHECDTFEYVFNKGKSCLFKINLDSLHIHLSNTPLYAMVLDMSDDIPKLIGTSQISLAKLVNQIWCDVEAYGISTPSSHGERATVDIFNLMGIKIGIISLGYKLISLGSSLLPHIPENRVHKVEMTPQSDMKTLHPMTKSPVPCEQRKSQSRDSADQPYNILFQATDLTSSTAKQRVTVSISTQTEDAEKHQTSDMQHHNDENPTIFCPPQLEGDVCPAEEDKENETDELELLNLELESHQSESLDPSTGGETPVRDKEGTQTDQTQNVRTSSPRHQTHVAAPAVLGEAIRQLPLLNALLVELSQLNSQGQMQQQPLSIHPNLAWIYRPVTESPAAPGESAKPQTKSFTKAARSPSPRKLKSSQPQGNLTTSTSQRDNADNGNRHPKSRSKRLVYGTTKTFRLRMKRVTPVTRHHECMEPCETQKHMTKVKQSSSKMLKCVNERTALNKSTILSENIETLISSSSIGLDPTKHKATPEKTINIKDFTSLDALTKKSIHTKQDNKLCLHIPSVQSQQLNHGNNEQKRDTCDASKLEPVFDNIKDTRESLSGSSKHSSAEPGLSDSYNSLSGAEEYGDDFTSLDPTDGYSPDPFDGFSPDPLSSPKPHLVMARSSHESDEHSSSDSPSDKSQRKVALPVPVKANSSPQRSLRGTHIIRPRSQASAISVSSDNSYGDGSATNRPVHTRNPTTGKCGAKRLSVSDSYRASGSQLSDSIEDSVPDGGCSVESNILTGSKSSPESHIAEELRDELGTLGFKNKYQHISELVANKLPGYTL